MATKHKIFNAKGKIVEVESTPRKAIRRFCIECMCYVEREVANCTSDYCPLYPFRSGKNTEISEERRESMRDNARKHFLGRDSRAKTAENQTI